MSSIAPPAPAEPLSNWAIQLYDRAVGFAWYVGKGTIVTQVTSQHGTVHAAAVVSNWIDLLLARHAREIEAHHGLLAIHDWRKVKKYESGARVAWFERMKQRREGYLRKAVVVTSANPLLKMAIAGGNLVHAFITRSESTIELASNLSEVLRKYKVELP
jgi:hypothetical protein